MFHVCRQKQILNTVIKKDNQKIKLRLTENRIQQKLVNVIIASLYFEKNM